MKKLILIALLFVASFANCQVTVTGDNSNIRHSVIGEQSIKGVLFSRYSVMTDEKTGVTLYGIMFRNCEYAHINDYFTITFEGKTTSDDLYSILYGMFTDENDNRLKSEESPSLNITLGETPIRIEYANKKTLKVILSDHQWAVIYKDSLDKLFGK